MSVEKIDLKKQSEKDGTKNSATDFCDWKMDDGLTFKKFNLIYGYNGTGKTTLSEDLKNKGSNIKFKEKEEECSVFVFNKKYVQENISSETIKTVDVEEEPENTNSTDIGKNKQINEEIQKIEHKNLNLLKKITAAGKIDKERNDLLSTNAAKIKNKFIGVGNNQHEDFSRYKNYDKTKLKNQMSKKEKQDNPLSSSDIDKKLTEIDNLSKKEKLAQVDENINDIDCSDIPSLLSNYLASDEKIFEEGATLKLYDWVKKGLEPEIHHGAGDECKFCGNKIFEERWNKLKKYFSGAAERISEKIKDVQKYKECLDRNIIFPEEQEFFKEHLLNYQSAKKSLLEAKEKQKHQAEEIISILNDKDEQRPLPTQKLSINFSYQNINSVIEQNNRDQQKEKDTKIHQLFSQCEEAMIADFLPAYEEKEQEKSTILGGDSEVKINEEVKSNEEEISKLKKDLENPNIFCEYFNKNIKNYFGHREFSLSPNRENTSYIFLRNDKKSDIESLSEGEKTAFVLLYFLCSLNRKEVAIKKSIVVIDDPISSLDSIHLHIAFAFIKNKIRKAKQIFILTHNLNFAQRIIKWFDYEKKQSKNQSIDIHKFFILHKEGKEMEMLFCIKKMPESIRYHCSLMCYLFKELKKLKESNGFDLDNIRYINAPNILRQFMEIYVSIWQPNKHASPENLKEIWTEQSSINLNAIIDFCNCYSHGSQTSDYNTELEILFHNENSLLKSIFTAIEKHSPQFYAALEKSAK